MSIIAEEIKEAIDNSSDVEEMGGEADMYLCERMEKDCLNAKEDLIQLLSKHPNWDEVNKRVVLTNSYVRAIDNEQAQKAFDAIALLADASKEGSVLFTFSGCFNAPGSIYLNDNWVKPIDDWYPEAHAHQGQKLTRVLRAIIRNHYPDVEANPEYERLYAKYADALSPIEVEQTTVLSVNPVDFMRMSDGNSWTSCHNIFQGGCYSGGCASYAFDTETMIMFTVDDAPRITTAKKINRQLFFWNGSVLQSSRLYPQDCDGDSALYTQFRQVVEDILTKCLGIHNLWRSVSEVSYTSYGYHYQDYRYSHYQAYAPSEFIDIDTHFYIGSDDPYCVVTGDPLDSDEHPTNLCGSWYCAHCDERIRTGDKIYFDGDYYCQNCADEFIYYCPECQTEYWDGGGESYTLNYRRTYPENNYTYYSDDTICPCCAENSSDYVWCTECGDLWKPYDVGTGEVVGFTDSCGDFYCPECVHYCGEYEEVEE